MFEKYFLKCYLNTHFYQLWNKKLMKLLKFLFIMEMKKDGEILEKEEY